MTNIIGLPAQRRGVFTVAEAASAGLTRSALRHAVGRGRCRVLRPGVLRMVDGPQPTGRVGRREQLTAAAIAAALANPHAVLSHTSAALLSELPVLLLPDRPCLTVLPRYTGDIAGVHRHSASIDFSQVVEAASIRRFDVARTVIDIGREHGVRAGTVTADAALHAGCVTPANLEKALAGARGWPGSRASALSIQMADGRAESPLESLSRLALRGRLPRPELQVTITDDLGAFVARVDFLWPDHGVVGEADGLQKYDDIRHLHAEKLRQERLEDLGVTVVRWGWRDLADVATLVDRIERACLRARGRRRHAKWSIVETPTRSFAPFLAADGHLGQPAKE